MLERDWSKMVTEALDEERRDHQGVVEGLQWQLDKLSNIVGGLLDLLEKNRIITVTEWDEIN